ncbi:MAG: hypothetical protein R3C52_16180, partial [Hyphomonadaceae bacterium]
AVLGILHSPSVYRNDQTQVLFNGDKPDKDWSLYCDLRLVLGAQALALLACIAAWVASNVLAEKYLG